MGGLWGLLALPMDCFFQICNPLPPAKAGAENRLWLLVLVIGPCQRHLGSRLELAHNEDRSTWLYLLPLTKPDGISERTGMTLPACLSQFLPQASSPRSFPPPSPLSNSSSLSSSHAPLLLFLSLFLLLPSFLLLLGSMPNITRNNMKWS